MTGAVVHVTDLGGSIAQIRMEDREGKNTFTDGILSGLKDSFALVQEGNRFKVVILTGYDNYFCSGGTKKALMDIQAGKSSFTDLKILDILVNCELPVIAAMQGHGIGAGFTFGLSADFTILSAESYYCANYMKYGFTPGFGATYFLPKKLGFPLAYEMLFVGENYRGAELAQRGIQQIVVPRTEVQERAIRLAEQLADKPRLSLTTLKRQFISPMREDLHACVLQELKMHEITFLQNDEAKERIDKAYGA